MFNILKAAGKPLAKRAVSYQKHFINQLKERQMKAKIKETSFEGSKMSLKACSAFFLLKQQDQSQYVILKKDLQ